MALVCLVVLCCMSIFPFVCLAFRMCGSPFYMSGVQSHVWSCLVYLVFMVCCCVSVACYWWYFRCFIVCMALRVWLVISGMLGMSGIPLVFLICVCMYGRLWYCWYCSYCFRMVCIFVCPRLCVCVECSWCVLRVCIFFMFGVFCCLAVQ